MYFRFKSHTDQSIERSFFTSYRTRAMNYFASLGIFMRHGMQDAEVTKSLMDP